MPIWRRVARRTARRTSRRMARRQEAADLDATIELEKLATLHRKGVITDEEFAAKKKQILGL